MQSIHRDLRKIHNRLVGISQQKYSLLTKISAEFSKKRVCYLSPIRAFHLTSYEMTMRENAEFQAVLSF